MIFRAAHVAVVTTHTRTATSCAVAKNAHARTECTYAEDASTHAGTTTSQTMYVTAYMRPFKPTAIAHEFSNTLS